jgi:hypothetical protein
LRQPSSTAVDVSAAREDVVRSEVTGGVLAVATAAVAGDGRVVVAGPVVVRSVAVPSPPHAATARATAAIVAMGVVVRM